KSLTQAERENTTAGKQLTAAIKQQDAELKRLDSQIGRSQRHVGDYGKAIKGVATNLLGAFGVVGGVAMFAKVMKDAFSTLRSFTKENAILAGVLGKTREEITELTDQAIRLGAVYPVTASEVVKLQVSFARLGFTMAEIQNLTEATIQGSIALNAGLDETATLVGAVVKAFNNLGTSDAQKIIDQLTLSTQRSSLSFASLETALPKVAGAANALNVPLSKTLSLLAIAQDATLDASTAGTSLRNIFLEISNEGITLEQALDKIQGSSNRLSAAYDLFGKRGAIVGLALADNRDKAAELAKEFENTGGVAARVAEEQMATLDGAIKSLDSSWEKFILGLRGSEGFLKSFISGIATGLDTVSDEFLTFGDKISILFGGVTGASARATLAANKTLLNFIKTANEDQLNEVIDANRKLADEGDEFAKTAVELARNRIVSIAKAESDGQKRAKNLRTETEIAELEAAEKIAEERVKAEKKANKEIESERERHRKEIRKENEKFVEDVRKTQRKGVFEENEDRKKADDEFLEDNLDKLKERAKQASDTSKEILKREADDEETRQVIRDAAFQAAGSIFDAITDRKIANLQKEFDVLMLQKEAELAQENLTAEEKQKIEEKFAKKAAVIKTKQAQAEKRGAIFSALINTAAAITKALPNLVLAAIAGGLGLVQVGVIAAQPIPQFAGGTKNTPSEFIAGEKGRELMTLRTGQIMMVDKPTHFKDNKYQGATINSNPETEKLMAQASSQGNVYFDTEGLRDDIKALHKTIKNKPAAIIQDGKVVGSQTQGHREIYLNKLKYGS
ncbi:phage tail tape measure protein, partial [Candidatus Pacearchaeota archaeon]|nr:phage tail tape measure protein [Candidatus Pacearchaeota archaeon]